MAARIPPMPVLDGMSDHGATEALGPLFEGAPRFVARIVADRPYGTYDVMLARAREIAHAMPHDEQVELLASHPRIGAPPHTLSEQSAREQGHAGPAPAAEDTVARELERLNGAYEERFGFRYVVFVAGRPRAAIVPLLADALSRDRDAELARGLDDVIAIAGDRLRRLAAEEGA